MSAYSGAYTACAAVRTVAALGWLCTRIAADAPVQETKRVCHDVPNVRQAKQHQRYPHDGVEYCGYLPKVSFRSNVTVSYNILKFISLTVHFCPF